MNKKLVKVVGENFQISKNGYFINNKGNKVDVSKFIKQMIQNSEIVTDVKITCNDFNESYFINDNIYNMGTIDTIITLRNADYKGNIIALDFANGYTPGGGYISGSIAQEESICRSSLLFDNLYLKKEFYNINKKLNKPIHTDTMIYSPNVPIIRNDNLEILNECKFASFLSCPAVNARLARKMGYTEDMIFKIMENRIKKILSFMITKNPEVIVLGNYGCGVFENNKLMIYDIFEKYISKYIPSTIKVVFSVI